MARNRRVFPFFLDGGVQEVSYGASDTTASWNGTSSYVEILTAATSTPTFTIGITDNYGKPIEHGTLIVVRNVQTGGETVTVDWSDEFTDGSQGQEVDLIQEGSGVMLLFKGPSPSNKKGEWVNLTSDTDKTDQSADLNVLGDLNVKGAFKLSSTVLQTATGSNSTATALDVEVSKPVIFVTSTGPDQGINLIDPVDDAVTRVVNVSANDVTLYPDGTDRTTIDGGPSIDVVAGGSVELYFPTIATESSNIIVFNNQG